VYATITRLEKKKIEIITHTLSGYFQLSFTFIQLDLIANLDVNPFSVICILCFYTHKIGI